MKNIYEVGRVYVWQNQGWPYAHLNGLETTVMGDIEYFDAIGCSGQETDTVGRSGDSPMIAEAGDLRPKNTPSGEQSVLEQFRSLEFLLALPCLFS